MGPAPGPNTSKQVSAGQSCQLDQIEPTLRTAFYCMILVRMATPIIFGIGAAAAALAGRHFLRQRAANAAAEWVRGGFQAKMDRKEAIQILGLR